MLMKKKALLQILITQMKISKECTIHLLKFKCHSLNQKLKRLNFIKSKHN